jgi:hypothetical protein
MLGYGDHALALHPVNISSGNLPGEIRIFSEVFEIPAIHRCAVDIHAGSQQKIHTSGSCISTQHGSHSLRQGRIPAGRKVNARSKGGGWAPRTHSHRSIGHLE